MTKQTETDFISTLLAPAEPVEKTINFQGKSGPAFFKLITAGERAQLLKGQRVQASSGKENSYEIDLGQNAQQKQLMVHFACCTPEGGRRFRSLGDVQAVPALLLESLYKAATEVNAEVDAEGEDEAGKS